MTTIAYTTGPDSCVRGSCGHTHTTREAAEACAARDNAGCRSGGRGRYSDRSVVELSLADVLQLERIPWGLIRDAGHSVQDIAREARLHGDEALYQRARRAAVRTS